jgi:hypothetical protein
MQYYVDQMIAERIQLPETILHPEGGMDHGVVLGHRADLEPDFMQSLETSQGLVLSNIGIVIPDKAATYRRNISDNGYQEE